MQSDQTYKPVGLSGAEAAQRLEKFGANEVTEKQTPALWLLLKKFWSPVPWMLEATVVLQVVLGKRDEAVVIAALLIFNAVLGFVQENRANQALALLKKRLEIRVRVLRDARWQTLPSRELVPGDVVHVRMGDLVPADLRLLDGLLQLDQSALTGEALPVDVAANQTARAGAVVKRGEATGEVQATGVNTGFGKTAELVRSAETASHLETLIFTIVRWLVLMDALLALVMLGFSLVRHLPLVDIAPFVLMLLVASVPAALPATFTLATALGALELAKRGVLVTRLSAIEEAASMDVLASDKTGTLTQNLLTLARLQPVGSYNETDLLQWAALASDDATQDPIDLAILQLARERKVETADWVRQGFEPFDPANKRSEAVYAGPLGALRVIKGAPSAVLPLLVESADMMAQVEQQGADGARVLAVAVDQNGMGLRLAGLLALQDPPRPDSAQLVQSLHDLGVRVMMVSGDGAATAQAVAKQVGIGERVCPSDVLRATRVAKVTDYDVFARVLPEDKFRLVEALQQQGYVVGMSGDGVNDAPALKRAEVGIAVASATDVAKAAASLVLTRPGLIDVLAAVETSRRIYQRMVTYTFNKIIKTIEIAIFLSFGFLLAGVFVVTPKLVVLLLFTNDFVTMSIASDQVTTPQRPQHWNVPRLLAGAGVLAAMVLILSFSVFLLGMYVWHIPLSELQTVMFAMLVFTGQGNVYLVREHGHFWHSRPGRWLMLASALDVLVVCALAANGVMMSPVPLAWLLWLLLVVIAYLFVADFLKVWLWRWLAARS